MRRLDRRWTLSPAGQALVVSAARRERDLSGIERTVLTSDARLSGPIRVTTVDLLALSYADAFTEFATLHPGIELEISTRFAIDDLSRDAEVAIRLAKAPSEHLIGRRIAHWPYGIYAAESLLARYPEAELGAMPWIGWDRSLGGRVTENWMRNNVPDAPVAARINSSIMFLSLLKRGVGVGHAPIPVAAPIPEIRQIAASPPNFAVDVWLLTHPDLRQTARVRALMDHLARATPRPAIF
jgi:DNA-binding transcriptional LysR family regulator